MKKIQYVIEYIFLKIFIWIINIFPWKYNNALSFFFLPLIKVIGNYKKITVENIKKSNINIHEDNLNKFINKVLRQNILTYIEMIKLMKMTKEEVFAHINFKNKEILEKLYENSGEKGIIFVLAHIGNWEILGQAVAYKYNLAAIARRQNNPYTENLIKKMRGKSGLEIIYREGNVALKVLRYLRKGYGVGFLNDQDGGISGITTEFMGRNCSTPPGPAFFGIKTESPICFCYTLRNEKNNIDVYFEEPFYPSKRKNESNKEAQMRVLQKLINIQEKVIKKNPYQWNWLANRWRTER